MTEPVVFRASFPPIQTAIRRDGSGGGMRISLDIPETEMAQAVMLLALVQERLLVTIEIAQDKPDGTGTVKRTKAKRRV
jgi:hypothetical protein